MKKFKSLMLLAAMFATSVSVSAQKVLLDEGFETDYVRASEDDTPFSRPVASGQGWTTVDTYAGETPQFKWTNYYSEKGTISGKHVAYCDGQMFSGADGAGPREEILLTPELDLDDTYQLSFDWKTSQVAFSAESLYDLQVRIVKNGDLANAETIFSIQNPEDLKESGVTNFVGWQTQSSKLDLSEWKGQKVKIAFVYKMLTTNSNSMALDNVLVKQFTPATTPVGKLNLTSYDYGKMYLGEKFYTKQFTLTNVGKKGLQITGVDMPDCVKMTLDPTTVNLDKNEAVSFQLSYTASLASPSSADVVLHTNGGDLTITLKATKEMLPDGMTEETFEAYFPPAGWKNSGWSATSTALEGDRSAVASVDMQDNYITTPRLDLTNGGKVIFEYYNDFTSEDGTTYQSNDIKVELSTDGGKTWTEKWIFPYQDVSKSNVKVTQTVDLGTGTDNSYVRWVNTGVTSNDGDVPECSNFYLDRILLPALYGQDGVPDTCKVVTPKDKATDIYPKDIKLEWTPALFAEGYNLYVGTAEGVYNVIDGQNVGNVLTYILPTADYETTYYWKVVAYNAAGHATKSPEWRFTTQKDASVADYPYTEDFSGDNLPTGWTTEGESQYNREWSVNTVSGNPMPCLYATWLNNGEHISVSTQEFKLPANKTMAISFDWGDRHPTDLVADASGIEKKVNIEPNNGVEKLTFEIYADGAWKELSYMSTDWAKEKIYWIRESFDLAEYAGKTVKFRWTHYSYSGKDSGGALDNVVLEEKEGDKAIFNKSGWNAGKVNYNMATNSGDIFTLINKGANTLKVKSATFATGNFETSIKAGDEIAAGEGQKFNIQFNAKDAVSTVSDNLTVTFESGYTLSLPVEGTALASNVYYYSFEDNDLDHNWKKDFTMIDVDRAATSRFTYYGTECPESGGVFAFTIVYERPNHNGIAPISGDAVLMAGTPLSENITGDNWIISQKLKAGEGAQFDFWARNLESLQSVLPSAKHKVAVLVSETGNSSTDQFTEVLPLEEIPFLDRADWKHYVIDLSAYAGKDIYVAVRDYNATFALQAFYDDFTFTNFVPAEGSNIQGISAEDAQNAAVTVYSLNGSQLAKGTGMQTLDQLENGIYVVRMQTADGVKTMKVTVK